MYESKKISKAERVPWNEHKTRQSAVYCRIFCIQQHIRDMRPCSYSVTHASLSVQALSRRFPVSRSPAATAVTGATATMPKLPATVWIISAAMYL